MAARKIGKSTIVWILMGFLVLGLGGFGISSFTGTGTGSVGSVGQTKIAARDYQRLLEQQINAATLQFGRVVTMQDARQLGLVDSVRQELVTSATLQEEARVLGVSVGDRAVAEALMAEPGFQGLNGQFDRNRYAEVLRRQNITEGEFEAGLRADQSGQIILAAVGGGIEAPRPLVDRQVAWLLETRDIEWQELTSADLPEPVSLPDEAALHAWHEANAADFTAPETRHFTYAWLTPDMLEDSVEVDDAALRDVYEANIDEYVRPARRMVDRLVYPSEAEAQAARAKADAGASFDELAADRGLTRADADLGEVTEAQLGAAGAVVFAAEDNGIVGPVQTDLGPALFSVNAIMDPVETSFEEARDALRIEAAADRARRVIEDKTDEVADLIAAGASLEDLASEAGMQVGEIDWRADDEAEAGSIAAYPAFRAHAASAQESDFPELFELEDGGIFALRLDSVTPPALIPFDEARPAVEADWLAAETRRRLLSIAEERREAAMAGAGGVAEAPAPNGASAPEATEDAPETEEPAAAATASTVQTYDGLTRDGYIEAATPEVVTQAFAMTTPGESEIVDAGGRVILVTLRAIHRADTGAEELGPLRNNAEMRLQQSLSGDLLDAYIRAALLAHGLRLDEAALTAVEARLP